MPRRSIQRGLKRKISPTRTAFRARGRLGARRFDLFRARGAGGGAAREKVRGERADAKGDSRHDFERGVPERGTEGKTAWIEISKRIQK